MSTQSEPDAGRSRSSDDEIQPWDDDHTALVHVLWAIDRAGLTLKDFDEVAARIRQSKYHRAVVASAFRAGRSRPTDDASLAPTRCTEGGCDEPMVDDDWFCARHMTAAASGQTPDAGRG